MMYAEGVSEKHEKKEPKQKHASVAAHKMLIMAIRAKLVGEKTRKREERDALKR